MIKDQWTVALKDKSLAELQEAYDNYNKILESYIGIKAVREWTAEEGRDFHTKSYRSMRLQQEIGGRGQ